MALGRHRARAAHGEVQCFPGGLPVGGLRLRGLILAELTPFLSWSCLGWTGGVGGRCTQRLVRPPFPEQEASGACSQRLRLTPRLPGGLRALGLGETRAALGAVGPAARAPPWVPSRAPPLPPFAPRAGLVAPRSSRRRSPGSPRPSPPARTEEGASGRGSWAGAGRWAPVPRTV